VLTEIIDASDEMAAHAALAEREELLNRLTEALPFGVAQLDAQGTIAYANDRWCGLLGSDDAAGERQRFGGVADGDRERLERAVADALSGEADAGLEVRVRPTSPTGSADERMCHVEVRSLGTDGPTGVLLCVTDVTESARLRHELEVRATVDDLTSCLNRSSILDVASWAVAGRDLPDAATGALFVDVDHFKAINDEHGHAAGDAVLREVARRLLGALRAGDRVGRLGGDEFLAVCPDLLRPDLALQIARRTVETISGNVVVGDVTIPLRVSVGVAWALNDEVDADALVALADAAMYESKRERSGTPVLRTTPVA
jgi:diguanylate cyclase (GGDEF)-like protein/PAS domain S-box-containing protein